MDKTEIARQARRLTNSDQYSYPEQDLTDNLNMVYDEMVTMFLKSQGKFQFDDSNYTTHPIGFTNLVQNQTDYSFDAEHLILNEVWVQLENGDYTKLTQIDTQDQMSPVINAITQQQNNTGTPTYFDLFGDSIWLYPTPNYSKENGLKVVFQRRGSRFQVSDTTKKPGIPQIYHNGIVYGVAYLYSLAKATTNINQLGQEYEKYKSLIEKSIIKRDKTKRSNVMPHYNKVG